MSGETTPSRARLLTPLGRGAVAVVVAEGLASMKAVDARFRAANGRRLADQPLNRIVFGHWRVGAHAEEVIVCRTDAAQVEIHCHGGAAAAERILAALSAAGCQVGSWQTASGLASETAVALAAAPTRRTAAILLDQHAGALQREIDAARSEIVAGQFESARRRLGKLDQRARLGLRLTQPWHVALAGPPNVGKSSLLNAILGYQRAIVFDQPGTTRDVLDATTAIDGWPVRLTDGAGLRVSANSLEARGVARAREELAHADLVVWVLDATTLSAADYDDAADFARRACDAEFGGGEVPAALLAVVNKIDLTPPPTSLIESTGKEPPVFVSAFNGAGLDDLLAAIARRLVPFPPTPGEAVPFTPRQTELIAAAIERLDAGDSPNAIQSLALITNTA